MKPNYSLDDLRCFCTVAQLGSFKAAAQQLAMPQSTLSRRIRQLEQDLALRLLNRDAHRISLTQIGHRYFDRAAGLFDELQALNDDLVSEKHHPQGKIRISAPINAGKQFLRRVFFDFMREYPEIQLDLNFSNSLIDIEAEGMDVVFRVGNPVVENWIARTLTDIHFILCASPDSDYHDVRSPNDLSGQPVVICHPMTVWELTHQQTGEAFDYQATTGIRAEVDEIEMLTHAVQAGFGIGYIPDYSALPLIEQGELQRVLPQWCSRARTLFLLYRDREQVPLRVRLLVEFVLARFTSF
ncbi:LysR family transcriptional regulator [Salinivibrio sp. IB574]|uniref:LysR family transcriptional regulator n=1 Tax=Salinivibrio sp. IB574 TaxID=1909444 RepID=UPI000988FD96|nr:LysR family transcriptional regulator [Salinivibrio sp. IB574]OOF22036.1 LysR family transcriptional regulator [Salinivibrio sp. IB574]